MSASRPPSGSTATQAGASGRVNTSEPALPSIHTRCRWVPALVAITRSTGSTNTGTFLLISWVWASSIRKEPCSASQACFTDSFGWPDRYAHCWKNHDSSRPVSSSKARCTSAVVTMPFWLRATYARKPRPKSSSPSTPRRLFIKPAPRM